MAGKEIAVKKYVVRLSSEERQQLETLIRTGKGPAQRLLKARILLKADVSEAGEGALAMARPVPKARSLADCKLLAERRHRISALTHDPADVFRSRGRMKW
jgi:hypothetical protein